MGLIDITTLFFMMAALAALPSASVALVITRAATLGVANGIAVAAGIVLGDLVFVSLAILGLSVVAETLGGVFSLVKVVGGLYLIWLGISLWRSSGNRLSTVSGLDRGKHGLVTSLVTGFVLTLGDVKAIVFYASLLPMVVDLSALATVDGLTIMAVIVLAVGGVKSLYAIFATQAARFLERRNLQKVSQKVVGGLMVAAGSVLVLRA